MNRLLGAAALLLIPSLAFAQGTPVYQSGTMSAPHNLAKLTRNGQVQDVGGLAGDALGRGINPFLILDSLGDGFCTDTAARTGTYHSLCIGHNAAGAPTFKVDGTSYPFLGVGSGNVIGPGSSSVNELASFNSTLGTLLRQGSAQLSDSKTGAIASGGASLNAMTNPNVTATTILSYVGGFSVYDAVRGVGVLNAGSSIVGLVNGVAGYVESKQAFLPGGFPTSVALFGVGVAGVNAAQVWGVNTLLTDNEGQTVSAGAARQLFNEFDFNVTSPNTALNGLLLQGASLSQPAIANGFVLGPLDIGSYVAANYATQWGAGLVCDDNVTSICVLIGLGGTNRVANQPSAFVYMAYRDSGNIAQSARFQSHPIGGNGGGFAGFEVSNAVANTVTNIGVTNGGFYTQDSGFVTNGLALGAVATSGNNVASQKIVGNYFDGGGTERAWFAYVDTSQIFQLGSTVSATAMKFNVQGTYYSRGTAGVTCAGSPTVGFATVAGIVTAC